MSLQPILIITLVLLLAAVMRLYHITQQSIWFDEAFAWNIVIQDDMYPRIAADTHPPLYYVLLRGWITVAGASPLALRYLSALISLITVALVYRVAWELTPHPRPLSPCGRGEQYKNERDSAHREIVGTANIPSAQTDNSTEVNRRGVLPVRPYNVQKMIPVLVALMLALSDAEIFLAQETRNYSLYTCLACLSMWLYLRWVRVSSTSVGTRHAVSLQRHQIFPALAWALATAALMYTHYQGAFIPAIQGMHALLFLRGRQRIYAVGALAFSGVLFAPWFFGVTVPQAQNAIDNSLPFAIPSNWETFLHLRDRYLGAMWSLIAVLMVWGVYMLYSVGTQHAASLPASVKARRRGVLPGRPYTDNEAGNHTAFAPLPLWERGWGEGSGRTFLVLMWLLLPFGVLFFGNYVAALLTERKLLIIAPAIALLVGFGLGGFDRLPRWVMTAAIVLYGVATVDYYRVKEPWNDITAEILPYVQETDLAMVEAGVGQYPVKYYWQRTLPDGVYFSTFPFLGDFTMAPTTDWFTYYDGLLPQVIETTTERRIGDVATAWLIFWSQDRAVIDRLEARQYHRTMTITYDHLGNAIDIYRYDHLPDTARGSYENGMILRAAEFDPDTLRADLWWSADAPLEADYTTSVLVLDENGVLLAQWDSPPPRPTTSWQAGDVIYDAKFLQLADGRTTPLPENLQVVVQVYLYAPENLINYATVDGEPWIEIAP